MFQRPLGLEELTRVIVEKREHVTYVEDTTHAKPGHLLFYY